MRLSKLLPALAITLAAASLAPPAAQALGPGGWDRLGSQVLYNNPASSLNGDVMAMSTDVPGLLIAGGKFTNAAGITGANKIAFWDGAAWHLLGPANSFINGDVLAVAVAGGKIYAGGSFTDAGGDANADFLAVYDGTTWKHACTGGGLPFNGNVHALQVVGSNLYVAGTFAGVGGVPFTGGLARCNLATDVPTSTIVDTAHVFNGPVYALTADSAGNLYAGGGFSNIENNPLSKNIARLPPAGVWTNVGVGPAACGCPVDDFVRALASDGTNVYVGSDFNNIAGIAQADHIAAWNGSSWHAVGSNAAGTDGYLPAGTSIAALLASGGHLYATGNNWLNVGGDPTADYLADFDGTSWKPIGSNGAGDGALTAKGESFAMFHGVLHVGGNFTKAGGDNLASFLARYTGVPNNAITVGKVKANPKNGTAKLPVAVPGSGSLTLQGKGIKSQRQGVAGLRMVKPVSGAGTVKLKVKAKGKTLKKLKAHGKVKVKVTVTFTPTGGFPRSEVKTVKLKLSRS